MFVTILRIQSSRTPLTNINAQHSARLCAQCVMLVTWHNNAISILEQSMTALIVYSNWKWDAGLCVSTISLLGALVFSALIDSIRHILLREYTYRRELSNFFVRIFHTCFENWIVSRWENIVAADRNGRLESLCIDREVTLRIRKDRSVLPYVTNDN